MDDTPPSKVLILAADAARVSQIAQLLKREGLPEAAVCTGTGGMGTPALDELEVIVYAGEHCPTVASAIDELPRELRPGVVRLGSSGNADVALPADATSRELALACRLLGEIVRLRRKLARGSQLHQQLAVAAMTDPLSGLPNRRAWDKTLVEHLTDAAPKGPRCVAIVDLDHFKRVNDRHGHVVGDAVLRTAGQAIRDGLRQDDFVARLGGDEFGLLLAVPDSAAARSVLDRVRRSLPDRLGRAGLPEVTASAGYCLWPTEANSPALPSPEPVVTAADNALHQAKQQGRDRVVVGDWK